MRLRGGSEGKYSKEISMRNESNVCRACVVVVEEGGGLGGVEMV